MQNIAHVLDETVRSVCHVHPDFLYNGRSREDTGLGRQKKGSNFLPSYFLRMSLPPCFKIRQALLSSFGAFWHRLAKLFFFCLFRMTRIFFIFAIWASQ